jgi:hypothetical protein
MKVVKRTIREVGSNKIACKRAPVASGRAPQGRKRTFLVDGAPPEVVPARLSGLPSKPFAGNGEVTSEKVTMFASAARFTGSKGGPTTRASSLHEDKARFITQPVSFTDGFGRFLRNLVVHRPDLVVR